MSTFSPNVTLKYSNPISNSVTANTTVQTIYTCPANSYAEVMLSVNGSALITSARLDVYVDGKIIGSFWRAAANSLGYAGRLTLSVDPATFGGLSMNTGILKVAAGQTVQVRNSNLNVPINIVGVEYINTP